MKTISLPFKKILLASTMLLLSLACNRDDEPTPKNEEHHEQAHWDYENTQWHLQGYSDCAGKVQSPVNIDQTQTIVAQLEDINFNYSTLPLKVVDTGHSIQVEATGKHTIEINGTEYTFKQFHFHHDSEHTVDGKKLAMELHLVHENAETGSLAVVGIFLQPGSKHALFEQVLENIPAEKNKVVESGKTFSLADWLPASKDYYTYTGSLTIPPCGQGIQWYVMKEPISVSPEQISAFAKKYAHTARPVQALNGRIIFEKQGLIASE